MTQEIIKKEMLEKHVSKIIKNIIEPHVEFDNLDLDLQNKINLFWSNSEVVTTTYTKDSDTVFIRIKSLDIEKMLNLLNENILSIVINYIARNIVYYFALIFIGWKYDITDKQKLDFNPEIVQTRILKDIGFFEITLKGIPYIYSYILFFDTDGLLINPKNNILN